VQVLICTGGSLVLHGLKTKIAPLQFTLYKNMHLRIQKIKNTKYWDALLKRSKRHSESIKDLGHVGPFYIRGLHDTVNTYY